MTSPDFMYPQPTDDELAAQQPYTAALGSQVSTLSRSPVSSPADANRPLLGKVALGITIIAAGLSLLASITLGVTIGPVENEHGHFFTDIPSWYQNLAIALAGLQVLCAALGVTGLIMGIVSAASDRARTQGIIAIAIAVLAPFISFGLFMILSLAIA
ncbi:hypothetical protein [Brevibacterium sp. 239c]|uniref:hypothetical protein n=1 Tax=Brevibacterium sp. 239c TaxID=1965356 RepID=UPI0011AFAB57|nr:hypothetical protein [Brevibacterium sp. 239c]